MLLGQICHYYLLKIPHMRFHRQATCLRCDPAPMPVCDNGPWLDKQSNTFEMQQTLSQWTVLHGKEPFTYDIHKIFRMLTPLLVPVTLTQPISTLVCFWATPSSLSADVICECHHKEEGEREGGFIPCPSHPNFSLSHGPPGLAPSFP